MTEDAKDRHRTHQRLWLSLAAAAALVAVLIVPPLVSIERYKSQITSLISASLGRPVSLSSVELRLLPWPGFVLTDLSVEEDPSYGVEPVLHANTVTATIRLLSLWRGRLEIGRISVDEASLNLVRTATGRWNLDSLLRSASVRAGAAEDSAGPGKSLQLPYLEATNSRINIKDGAEKLPFSLIGADLAFWQETPGVWRIRLRGQPARTDVSLNLADTGMVRLDATVHRAAELRRMPVHLDLIWREAQLGQLSRLVLGSDPGWRGDLTGELHLDGTPEAAQVKTRLRATGVHRAEFAPVSPMDFDANCGFLYHFSGRAVENAVCDTELGDGHIRLTGELPSEGGSPHFSVELDRVPVAAGLDALRTVRSGFGPGLEARGVVGGKLVYAPVDLAADAGEAGKNHAKLHAGDRLGKTPTGTARAAVAGPLTGSLTVYDFQLSGDGLGTPIQLAKIVWTSVVEDASQQPDPQSSQALSATVAIPGGAATPLTVNASLMPSGYRVKIRGEAALSRAKELARLAGLPEDAGLEALTGDAANVDLSAEGPWLATERTRWSRIAPDRSGSGEAGNGAATLPTSDDSAPDQLTGVVTLHNAVWKAGYLANPVEIAQATLLLENGETRWDHALFTYGPVKGTASLAIPRGCGERPDCRTEFHVQFGALDAGAVQAALLGAHPSAAHPSETMLAEWIARLRPSSPAPAWPQLAGTVKADSVLLGPVMLRNLAATLRILPSGTEITGLEASLLGGAMHGYGTLRIAGTDQDKPTYSLEAQFEKLSPPMVGLLLGQHWQGGQLDGNGKLDLSGFTAKELASTAKGALHFDWRRGSVGPVAAGGPLPAALAHFDAWTAETKIANGAVTLEQNEIRRGGRTATVEGSATVGGSSKVSFAMPK